MCSTAGILCVCILFIYIYYGRILNHIDRLLIDSDWTVNSGSRFHSRTVVYDSDWTMMMMIIIYDDNYYDDVKSISQLNFLSLYHH